MGKHDQWGDVHYDYRDRTVLITGGTSGIGAGIAAAYHAAGAQVVITGTRPTAEDYPEDLSHYRYLRLDVTDHQQIEDVVASLSTLDILVNNGGVALIGDAPDLFDQSVHMHLTSVYRLSHACRNLLAESPYGGNVIGIASMTSYFGMPVVPGYGAAKAGLVQMTKTLAMAWADQRIRVNALACGLIETRMTAGVVADAGMSSATLARTPQKRFGTPEDVAGAALFLSSAAASFITGQTLPVDGGYSIVG